ncbi:hypothetical protein ABZ929_01165 [Streptomyces physcomitrii]|uniref:hypothetical protein n=1 Tax=Streptomyces physcomitrii TaxID=2724184 RepID=UPI0033FA5F99
MNITYAFGVWTQKPGQPGMDVRIIHEMSEDEFTRHVDAVNAYETLVERGAFSLILRNHSNLQMMVDTFANVERYAGEFRQTDREVVKRSLMAELTNWLAATRLYLENERDFILREFGKSSEEMSEYKNATSSAFDEHVGYRFLYNLRDYTQHCGIPPGRMHVSGTRPNRNVAITLDRSRLLMARFNWSSHAKLLLEGWPEQILLMPLLEDAMAGYAAVEDRMLQIAIRRCIAVSPLLLETLRSGDLGDGNPALFRISGGVLGGQSTDFSLRTIPVISTLEAVMSAAKDADPLESLRVREVNASPKMPTSGKRASAVLSSFFVGGGQQAASETVNRILQEDGDVSSLISDLINVSTVLTHMLSQILGASPHALLGKLGDPDAE